MTFDQPRPNKPNPPQPNRPQAEGENNQPRRRPPNNGNGGNRPNNRPNNGNNQPPIPSPWLKEEQPAIANTQDTFVSFVEYLRWMREPNHQYKDPTKIQILQLAAEKSKSYKNRLQELTKRTELIAGTGNTFRVKSTGRLRVGGHRGPESILLPAFDALGIPYLPSSTLRGVARSQAIKEFMAEGMSYERAVEAIAPYFGSIDTDNPKHRSGKVIFLDAYPLANQSEFLALDMANNLWKWNGNELEYNSNPNLFISLKESTFLIGIKPGNNCDYDTCDRVKKWLIAGLQSGVGSQLNSGYGEMNLDGQTISRSEILSVKFSLEGQLIHGHQKFNNIKEPYKRDRDGNLKLDKNGKLQSDTLPVAEVRPIAFKSMLRYWFRAFALGVLDVQQVQELEGKIFGAITPKQHHGWVRVSINDSKIIQVEPQPNYEGKNKPVGKQSGTLVLSYSTKDSPSSLAPLMQNLTWMMFHLGGIGQGARRPCYSRKSRQNAPWWRGSNLSPERDDDWIIPNNVEDFQKLFQTRLKGFYTALSTIAKTPINPNKLRPAPPANPDTWIQAIDSNCKIIVCAGKEDFDKPYALAILHSDELKRTTPDKKDKSKKIKVYDGNLCGEVQGDPVKPSPVWICDLGNYQVVTVFGANVDPRLRYLGKLRQDTKEFKQIFPLT
jgi:CRISPR-associated protein Cmr6